MRVHRARAAEVERPRRRVGAAFPLGAEAQGLDTQDGGDGEGVVDAAEVGVADREPGAREGHLTGRAQAELVQVRHLVHVLVGRLAPEAEHAHRGGGEIASALHRGEHHRAGPVGHDRAVEQAEGIRDGPGRQVVGEGQGLPHLGARVEDGVSARRDRDRSELRLGGAVAMHVALGDQRVRDHHPDAAEGLLELLLAERRSLGQTVHALGPPGERVLAEGAERHLRVALADGRDGVQDHVHRGHGAARVDGRGQCGLEPHVLEQALGEHAHGLRVGVEVVDRVHLPGSDPGVGQGQAGGLGLEPDGRAALEAAHRGLGHAHDADVAHYGLTRCLAMMFFWIWVVPSPMQRPRASRSMRSTGNSRV